MREILFRGKRVDNGEWVYGDLVRHYENQRAFILTDQLAYTTAECGISRIVSERYFEVIPETVGQCIVPKDKNRNKMFEGDILNKDGHWAVVVEYDRVMPLDKVQYFNSSGTPINDFYFQVWEVAGNIHDKKEEEKCLPEI